MIFICIVVNIFFHLYVTVVKSVIIWLFVWSSSQCEDTDHQGHKYIIVGRGDGGLKQAPLQNIPSLATGRLNVTGNPSVYTA